MHLRANLGYADFIADRRIPEQQEVLDTITEELLDCDRIVLLGDNFNSRNNTSEVIKTFITFLKSFGDKEIYILAGNHEKWGDGRSALDFIKKLNIPNWHVISNEVKEIETDEGNFTLCPYFTKSELGVTENVEGAKKVAQMLVGGDVLFVHHAIAGTKTEGGTNTSIFDEIVLPQEMLERNFKYVIGGHVHKPQAGGRTLVAGSIFNNEVNETGKFVYKIELSEEQIQHENIRLPGRGIYKVENPNVEEPTTAAEITNEISLSNIPRNSIVKVILTKDQGKEYVEKVKEALKKFDASLLLEQYPRVRKKLHFEEGMIQFNVASLLSVYAKERKVDENKLIKAFNLIE